jgi:hypothetical protein
MHKQVYFDERQFSHMHATIEFQGEGSGEDTVSRCIPWFNVIVDELEEVESGLSRLVGNCDVLISTATIHS